MSVGKSRNMVGKLAEVPLQGKESSLQRALVERSSVKLLQKLGHLCLSFRELCIPYCNLLFQRRHRGLPSMEKHQVIVFRRVNDAHATPECRAWPASRGNRDHGGNFNRCTSAWNCG